MNVFEALRADLAKDDDLLASALTTTGAFVDEAPTALIAGPGTDSDPAAYHYGVEAIREGHLLHWGQPRLVETDDQDLALLAGDRLYAAGLERIAATGDTETISRLSRLIMGSAAAMAAKDPAQAERVWEAACADIGSARG